MGMGMIRWEWEGYSRTPPSPTSLPYPGVSLPRHVDLIPCKSQSRDRRDLMLSQPVSVPGIVDDLRRLYASPVSDCRRCMLPHLIQTVQRRFASCLILYSAPATSNFLSYTSADPRRAKLTTCEST